MAKFFSVELTFSALLRFKPRLHRDSEKSSRPYKPTFPKRAAEPSRPHQPPLRTARVLTAPRAPRLGADALLKAHPWANNGLLASERSRVDHKNHLILRRHPGGATNRLRVVLTRRCHH